MAVVIDYEGQLVLVQTAIESILEGGQSVSYRDRSVTYADLEWLQKREEWLLKQISRAPSGGGVRARLGTPV